MLWSEEVSSSYRIISHLSFDSSWHLALEYEWDDLTFKFNEKSHLKYDRVNILTEQVEEEPVADVTLPDYCVYAFFFHSPAKYTNDTPYFLKCLYAFTLRKMSHFTCISGEAQMPWCTGWRRWLFCRWWPGWKGSPRREARTRWRCRSFRWLQQS